MQLNMKTTNSPIKKMSGRPKRAFFLKKTYRWPRGTWQDAQHIIREMQIKTTVRS